MRQREKDLSLFQAETICRQMWNRNLIPGFVGRHRSPRDWFWKDGQMYTPSTIQHLWIDHGYRPWRPYG